VSALWFLRVIAVIFNGRLALCLLKGYNLYCLVSVISQAFWHSQIVAMTTVLLWQFSKSLNAPTKFTNRDLKITLVYRTLSSQNSHYQLSLVVLDFLVFYLYLHCHCPLVYCNIEKTFSKILPYCWQLSPKNMVHLIKKKTMLMENISTSIG
jgi:hypothetical protein